MKRLSLNARHAILLLFLTGNAFLQGQDLFGHQVTSCVLNRQVAPSFADKLDKDLLATPGSSTVYFVTEREPIRLPAADFKSGKDLVTRLIYGTARVELPSRTIATFAEMPKSLKIEISIVSREEFFLQVRSRSLRLSGNIFYHPTVYVHGFNNTYREEIWRAANLGGDVFLYDWPSQESMLMYARDLDSIKWSAVLMADFLTELENNLNGSNMNIIAHSMGAYGLTNALHKLSVRGQLPRIANLILAAADVELQYFQDSVRPAVQLGKIQHLTIYASRKDLALIASERRNHYTALGLLPNLTRFRGARTVDTSNVSRNLLGHDYFVTSPEVRRDVRAVILGSSIGPVVGTGAVVYPRLSCSGSF